MTMAFLVCEGEGVHSLKVKKSFSDQTLEQGHFVPSGILGPDIIELGKPKDNAGGQPNVGV